MKVLVVGSGGREHCLVWKIAQSPRVSSVYCAPGNGGTATIASNVDIPVSDTGGLLKFALEHKIDLTVVGPEAPLVDGIVDKFRKAGLCIFGPDKELAQLEGSKIFAKEMMQKFGVPTAAFRIFTDAEAALTYLKTAAFPLVVKADGLAAGKGVVVAASFAQARAAVKAMLVDKQFGSAGERIIIEECLQGEEASILVFSDGKIIVPLQSSQDHKRIFDDDQGPNTGGMGAYSPAPLVTEEVFNRIIKTVCEPLIFGLAKEHKFYRGILYAGLMIRNGCPSVLEFNVRFGDPETQAILPRLKSDIVPVMLAAAKGNLDDVSLIWDDRPCVCVVLASGGYPGAYTKGKEISGLDKLISFSDVFAFHAGTALTSGPDPRLVTAGGRVLGISSLAPSLPQAQSTAYNAIESVHFEGMHYRKDIGNKALHFFSK